MHTHDDDEPIDFEIYRRKPKRGILLAWAIVWAAFGAMAFAGASGCAAPGAVGVPPSTIIYTLHDVYPSCETRCGLRSTGFDCSTLKAMEDVAVVTYAEHVPGWTRELVCAALQGWTVRVHSVFTAEDLAHCRPNAWRLYYAGKPLCIAGYTDYASRVFEVDPVPFEHSSFVHEVGHVLSNTLDHEPTHCGWMKRGIRKAIFEVNRHMDANALDVETTDCR
jgi:hypothetical protein